MPLSPVSPNVKAVESTRKRTHDEFAGTSHASVESSDNKSQQPLKADENAMVTSKPQVAHVPKIEMTSPPTSSPPCLAETGSDVPVKTSPLIVPTSPKAMSPVSALPKSKSPAKLQGSATSKKRKLTVQEKELEQKDKKQKQEDKKRQQEEAAKLKAKAAAEKEAAKVAKAEEKAKQDAAKVAKAEEKAKQDAVKEAAKAAKAEEKAKQDAAKEAKKLEKQKEEQASKATHERQQNMMANFLKKPPTTPSKKSVASPTKAKVEAASPAAKIEKREPSKSAYDLAFQPFFVKSGVTLAPSPFEMDNETKEAKSNILDEYINGARGEFVPSKPFNAVKTFDLAFPQQRGIIPPSVKKIMETIHGDSFETAFAMKEKTKSQTEKLYSTAQDHLSAVPIKYLKFFEDVRPAYYGTMSTPMSYHQLRKLSRRPSERVLKELVYDYDSEAEWVEDDGEDLDDAEDDEEDVDGDEEMDDFVDDSEAVANLARPGFEADSLPVSTGICWENKKRLGPSATVYKYRLEILLDTLPRHTLIDPFSTEYWPSSTSSVQGTTKSMLPPVAPKDAAGSATSTPATSSGNISIPQNVLADFKRALVSDECRGYSKATVVELLAKRFTSVTKAQVKSTIDAIAHRVTPPGAKKSVKHWVLLPGHGLEGT
ncbi:chromatin assembly factor 1 subunit A-domain-containing protein [Xylariaceae sp. FL0255]|nr:chromatin assembly factor 1 subunit A-domain-containing protein [Xylariaceae sp. FL0255]